MPRPNAGRTGRKKGVPNKLSRQAKELVLAALDEVGGKDWLVALAREEPRAFAALIQKLVPQEIAAKVDSDFTLVLNVGKRELNGGSTPDLHLGPPSGPDPHVQVDGHGDSEDRGRDAHLERLGLPMAEAIPDPSPDRSTHGTLRDEAPGASDSESLHLGPEDQGGELPALPDPMGDAEAEWFEAGSERS